MRDECVCAILMLLEHNHRCVRVHSYNIQLQLLFVRLPHYTRVTPSHTDVHCCTAVLLYCCNLHERSGNHLQSCGDDGFEILSAARLRARLLHVRWARDESACAALKLFGPSALRGGMALWLA